MKRIRTLAVAVLLIAGYPLSVGATPRAAVATPATLTIVSQTNGFNLAPDTVFNIVVQAPPSLSLSTLVDAEIIVTAYDQLDGRAALEAALAGELSRSVDAVDIPLAGAGQPAAQQLSIAVPTETTRRSVGALQLSRSGLYPVVIDIRSAGEVVAEVVTFVNRLPASGDPAPGELNVALAVGTTVDVGLDADGFTTVGAPGLDELATLVQVLTASAIPVTVNVPPSMISAVRRSNPELADQLLALLSTAEVLSGPVLPLDPSAAAGADQEELYTQWFRDGEDLLAAEAGLRTIRTVSFVDQPISQAGGALLRALGSRLLVLPTSFYDTLEGGIGGFTDTTQLIEVELDGGAVLNAALPDRTLAQLLARSSSDPVRNAIIAVADLLAARTQIDEAGADPSRHSILLATPTLELPDPATLAAMTQLIATTPGLRAITVDDLGSRTDTLLLDGGVVRVALPAAVGPDIRQRISTANALWLESASAASMLDADSPEVAQWEHTIARMPSSALTDQQVADLAVTVRNEQAAIRASVVPPPPFSFVLTGRSSMIRLRIRNTGPTPVTVRLRLASTKLVFPLGDQLAVLAPDSFTEVEVPVEARSNGRFPVSLEIFTPLGDTYVTQPIPLTASVNALTGLGNLITGAALLILLAWWAHHFRVSRRRKRVLRDSAARSLDDTGEIEAPVLIDDSLLSPDAATSTLPP